MFNSRSLKKAITLAELLMAIGVLGVIAALVLPLLLKAMPNKEEAKHTKVNSIIEQVISQLYDDEVMYPRRSDFGKQGFQNTDKSTINGVEYEGDTKFCQLFASRFQISSDSGPITCENEINESDTTLARGKKSFTSKDGVDWYLPATSFSKGVVEVIADINGSDEGQNCIEGDTGCTKPDKFIYYVKSNGTITNKKPANVIQDKFKIEVRVTTEGCENATCQKDGGSYQFASLIPQANGKYEEGTYSNSNANDKYENLASNTRYVIKAIPKDDYYTNWSMNKKRVSVYNSDVFIDLAFKKRKKYCVNLKVNNCDKSLLTQCATYKLQGNCAYQQEKTPEGNPNIGAGEYELNSDGAFEYVGLNSTGSYNYKCSGTSKSMTPYNSTVVRSCDLTSGDYLLKVEPNTANGYYIFPKNEYQQNIPLGSNDLSFSVDLTTTNPE